MGGPVISLRSKAIARKVVSGASALVLAATILAACGGAQRSALPPPAVLPAGPVGHAGRWLVDSQGRVLLLHGVNVVAKNAPYYPSAFGFGSADAAWLASQGLDVVRLGVLPSGEMPTMGKIDVSYIDQLVSTLHMLARHHIFTLLDWHQDGYGTYFDQPGTYYRADGFPTWMTITNGAPDKQAVFPFDYTSNPALQEAFQAFWDNQVLPGGKSLQAYDLAMLSAVAKRVAGDPWVLGYEVMNEPWPGTTWLPCLTGNGCPSLDATELDPYYARAARAIRAVDPHHMIFFEPFVTYNFGLAPTHIALPRGISNTGMAFHQYAQSPAAARQVFANSLAWSKATGGALLNTEWSSAGTNPASIIAQANDEDAALMPWTYWVFSGCNIACSPARQADLLLHMSRPPVGSNVNAPVVDAVVRPHPVAVAGVPLHLAYDPSSHVMTFSWSPERAGGTGYFGAGATSVFAVPRLDYPLGYTVHASGVKVLSAPNASTLVVAERPPPAKRSPKLAPELSIRLAAR